MLTIVQVFNNSVALVKLADERQALVRGKGIAFQKKKGDEIDPAQVDRTFYLETADSKKNVYFLMKGIPIDIVLCTYEVVNLAQKKYHYQVLDYVYITLSDHIFGVYKRIQAGEYVESLVPDMEHEYPTEYALAQEAVGIIAHNLNIELPASERKNIALHFINAKGVPDQENHPAELAVDVNNIVSKVLTENHILRSKHNSSYYDRLMVHLQYLVDRVNVVDDTASEFNESLEKSLEQSYPVSSRIAIEMVNNLEDQLNTKLSNNEKLYFIIHIQRIINEQQDKNNEEVKSNGK